MGEYIISEVEDGEGYLQEPLTVQDIDIESSVSYPKYDNHRKLNDIALIRLKTPANLKKINIGTICLPVDEENLEFTQQHLTIAGLKMTQDSMNFLN